MKIGRNLISEFQYFSVLDFGAPRFLFAGGRTRLATTSLPNGGRGGLQAPILLAAICQRLPNN